jgi:hypothetical protein
MHRGESKKVKIVENNQTQKVTRKGCSNISHTLLTPPDKLHDKQRMNNSKGPCDPDDIHKQLLKHLLESSHQTLLDLMNDIWKADNMPSIWKLANIIRIPKPGKDHSEPSNYWHITLASCVCKTMERMINAHLVLFLEPTAIRPIIPIDL